jgi:uncharacterized membrane protein
VDISGDLGGFIFGTIVISLLIPLVITVAVIVTIIWVVRRSIPSGRDAAIVDLRARFARGEIDQSEFEARMDSLTREE